MASIPDLITMIETVYRDSETMNLPASDEHEPVKSEIRDLLKQIVELSRNSGTTLAFATVADLEALPTEGISVGDRAEVRADPGGDNEDFNGVWAWSGTEWVWLDNLVPQSVQDSLDEMQGQVEAVEDSLGGQAFREIPSVGLAGGRPISVVKFDRNLRAYDEVALNGVLAYAQKNMAVDLDPYVCYIYVQGGQSNAEAVMPYDEGAVIADTPIYPGQAFMSELGARINTRDSSGPFPAPRSRRFDAVLDLVEYADPSIQCYETSTSSTVNHLIKMVADGSVTPLHVFGMTVAHGAYSIFDLKRGSDVYGWFLMCLSDAVAVIRKIGFRPVMLPISWCQGESDAGTTNKSAYCTALLQFVSDLNADVKRIIGTDDDIKLMVDAPQMAQGPVENDIVEAQVMAAGRDSRIILAPPYYQHERTIGQPIHMSAVGQNHKGVDNARTLYDAVFGGGHMPLEPIDAWFEAGMAAITLRWPRPVMFDTSGDVVSPTGLPGYYGLFFDDRSGAAPTITGHSFIGGGSSGEFLMLTLSGVPNGPRPRISNAFLTNAGGEQGPITGMRSLIRSTRTLTNLYDSATIYEWSRPFVLSL